MQLDFNPIHEQLKRIADYLELLAANSFKIPALKDVPNTAAQPKVDTQLPLFDIPTQGTETTTGQAVEKKRGRPKKDSVEQAKVDDLNAEIVKTEETIVAKATEQDVRENLMRFVQRNTKDEALALLKKYGAMKIKDLKPVDYDPIVAEMKADEELFHGKGKK